MPKFNQNIIQNRSNQNVINKVKREWEWNSSNTWILTFYCDLVCIFDFCAGTVWAIKESTQMREEIFSAWSGWLSKYLVSDLWFSKKSFYYSDYVMIDSDKESWYSYVKDEKK